MSSSTKRSPKEAPQPRDGDGRNWSGQSRSPNDLSQSVLDEHNQIIQHDHHFAEGVTRDKATHDFYQALAERQDINMDDETAHPDTRLDPSGDTDIKESLAQIMRLHRTPASSSTTPLERYLTVSSNIDPFPLYAKRALSTMGCTDGTTETLDARAKAARMLAAAEECSPYVSEDGDTQRAQSAPTNVKPRVHKTVKQTRKRQGPPADSRVLGMKRMKTA